MMFVALAFAGVAILALTASAGFGLKPEPGEDDEDLDTAFDWGPIPRALRQSFEDDADGEPGEQHLRDADVEVVRPLGADRRVRVRRQRVRGAEEFLDRRRIDLLRGRRREVARVARVDARGRREVVRQAEARTPLLLVRHGRHVIEARAEVDREFLRRLPFVLQVHAVGLPAQPVAVVDRERRGARLVAVVVGREDRRLRARREALALREQAGAQRVLVGDSERGVALHAGRVVLADDLRADAVEEKVAERVRLVRHVGVAGEQ